MVAKNVAPLRQWNVGSHVISVAISHDGTRVASGSLDGLVRIWDVHTGGLVVGPLKGHTNWARSVVWSHDDTRIISCSGDKTIRIWDSRTGALIAQPLVGHADCVQSVAWSYDDARIISGSNDKSIRTWDARTGVSIDQPLTGHTNNVYSVALSQDSTRIVSGSRDNTICIWETRTGALVGEPLEGHTGAVFSVVFSHDGIRIVSGSQDQTIRIWSAHNGAPIGEPLKGHTAAVASVAFSHDGSRIVSGSEDNAIRIWSAHSGAPIGEPLKGHTGTINSVAISQDSSRIVSGSDDKTICVWDACTGTLIGEPLMKHTGLVYSVAFSQDSSRIVSGSYDDTICVWETPQKAFPFNMAASKTPAQEILESFVEHGGSDLSLSIDSSQYSSSGVVFVGFGDVLRARTNAGVMVAVKFLRPRFVREGGDEEVKRMALELSRWSKVKHDNIQELLGMVIFHDQIGTVSPWVDNGTLGQYIQDNPTVDRYPLCIQVAKGVSYLHGIGMIHGDINSLHVLVSADGIAKINGFDYSILSDGTLPLAQSVKLGPRTLRWMAPELLREQEEGGPPATRNKQTDVYALGMTMLEIVTGRVPYCEYSYEMAIYGAICKTQLPRRPNELPEDDQKARTMWELLLRCWDHNPSGRPDAEDIAPIIKVLIL